MNNLGKATDSSNGGTLADEIGGSQDAKVRR
jgi:hypothetical protein